MDDTLSTLEGLIAAAREARLAAYAPYSNFTVGAAVQAGSGRVYTGANVENASYGLTICAERVAIFAAIASGERVIQHLVLVTGASQVTPPCGACRQVLSEFGPNATIVAECRGGDRHTWTIVELLPDAFSASSLRLETTTVGSRR